MEQVSPYKMIHKGKWKSTDNVTVSKVDYILMDPRQSSDLKDVKRYSGHNVDSDYLLVMAEIRGSVSNLKKDKSLKQQRTNVENLHIDTMMREY